MPYLNSIRVFIRTVELGSISAAGRDQRLTPAVASNRIKELESRLGIRLFNRTTRKMAPTEVGRLFYEHAKRVVETLNEAESVVENYSQHPRGSILMMAPLGLARRAVAPFVPVFNEMYPDLSIRMRMSDRNVDILEEGVDVAFLLGPFEDSSMTARKIMDCPRVLCAAPAYLEKYGMPTRPIDLINGQHRCLLLRFPGSFEYFWQLETEQDLQRFNVSGPFDADDGDVLTDWAIDGQGIINKPYFEVADYIKNGVLVPILEATPPPSSRLACLYPHRRLQDPKIRLFIDFMTVKIRERLQNLTD